MSSQIVCIRVPPLYLAAIDGYVKAKNKAKKGKPLSRSTFVLESVMQRLAHVERSAKCSKKKSRPSSTGSGALDAAQSVAG